MRVALIILLVLSTGCPTDDCTPNETRCYSNASQICGSDQRWRTFATCPEIGPEWVCCWQGGDPDAGVPAGHTCLPNDECPEGDGP